MTLQKDPEGYEKGILHKFVEFENKQVLEIGCGDGRLTWKYAAASKQVVGIDVEFNDLRFARIDHPADPENRVLLAQASARDIPFPREEFEIVILAWSL
jgi:ubiquinone/menaquinone biosynthesis C-methylase UbiE